MSICARGRVSKLVQRLATQIGEPVADLPAFLCPGLLQAAHPQAFPLRSNQPRIPSQQSSRRLTTSAVPAPHESVASGVPRQSQSLPQQCAGCGALSQTVLKDEPGFYSLTRRSVKDYLSSSNPKVSEEDAIIQASLKNAGDLNLGDFSRPTKNANPPVCDRCHTLKHHEVGVSIHHPSIHSIQDTIFESPFKYNHIYHVIDAADFPMSLVPGLHKLLHLTPQRSLNRRSKTGRFYHGQKTEVSFIITRSDLLAPLKSQVDSMMPYLRSVLRDALGRAGKDVRLGNIRCISAKQGWWTKELKEEIWKRGGGGWMVGKVNVGKSQLFHDVFPKGRKGVSVIKKPTLSVSTPPEITEEPDASLENTLGLQEESNLVSEDIEPEIQWKEAEPLDTSLLLPPAPPETDYPAMPLVSSLPGTTASPIRLSFGNGKGELIDLPGLSRGDFELHVQPQHRSSLVMRSRVRPEQQVIKPGQSLLLGGFIRITPTTPNLIMLAYAFTPINPHLTSTAKAIGTQEQTRESTVENISLPGTGEKIASAGTFHLKWDVTKERSGPLTASDAGGIKVEQLPYRVLATDILIEGCGWVELVAQVRKKHFEQNEVVEAKPDTSFWGEEEGETIVEEQVDPSWPTVEVFTPKGKFIAVRRPMNAWLHIASKPTKGKLQGRPRKSMKGVKKAEKQRGRMQASV
ncbi:hypothetical protein G7Y89_g2374 [Cudoniella acicularis]|uniref:Uncharacterized protein n=1 Tax=Cudoniella acicularis TaxID=354080 RepID=A0A8H4W6K2_9HELO|nr:hypothetical protein G7Y89_g2374 [Cudoniella acicularis]